MLRRIVGLSVAHPWKAIATWFAIVAACVVAGTAMPTKLVTADDYTRGTDFARAEALQKEAGFITGAPTEMVLITGAGDAGGASQPTSAMRAAAADVARAASRASGVTDVAPPIWSPTTGAGLVTISLATPPEGEQPDVAPLQATVARLAAQHPEVTIRQAGDTSVNAAINARVADDMAAAERTTLPVTLIIMLVVFGALVAAGLPVLVAGTSVAAGLGLAGPLSQIMPLEPSALNLILVLGMAVGVDYSLFYLKREREERRRGRSARDAVLIAAQTSGHSIIVSGLAVALSLTGLAIMGDVTFMSLAMSAVSIVVIAVLGSLIFLPALLTVLGRWVDWPRLPWRRGARTADSADRPSALGRGVAAVTRRPLISLVLGLSVVAALIVPAFGLKTEMTGLNALPQDIPEVAAYSATIAAFPAQGERVDVVARTGSASRAEVNAALTSVAGVGVWTLDGRPTWSSDGSIVSATLTAPPGAPQTEIEQGVTALRGVVGPRLEQAGIEEWAVGGSASLSAQATERYSERRPWVIAAVLLTTAIMVMFAFRSPVLGLVTTVLNLLSTSMAFGVLALVFQSDWGADLLGFTNTGAVTNWVPVFLFAILVGLSMDYHVFVLSRIKENIDAGMPTRAAIADGIGRTAGVVTSAAIVMVAVFAVFVGMSLVQTQAIGVGLATAILIDATLVRLVLLPSILALLGRAAWWPGTGRGGRRGVRSSASTGSAARVSG
ncbi:MMPL family transporter [Kribbia dieselivorans]|uniref:MMPL family transporter n=1 Tax=Kribbia dieselivorans TaxID=331526 RepID=UPI000837E6A4|nr:MMPL family transporter [Kribbia dieselivorans]